MAKEFEQEKIRNTVTYIAYRLGLTLNEVTNSFRKGLVAAFQPQEKKPALAVEEQTVSSQPSLTLRPRPNPKKLEERLDPTSPHHHAAVVIRSNNPQSRHGKPRIWLVENGYIVDTGNTMSLHPLTSQEMYYYGISKGLLPNLHPASGARRLAEEFALRHGYREIHPSAQVDGTDSQLQYIVCEILENRHFIIPGKTSAAVASGNYLGVPTTAAPQGMPLIPEQVGQQAFPKVSGENPHDHEGSSLQLNIKDPSLRPEVLPFAATPNSENKNQENNVVPLRPRPSGGGKKRGGPGKTPTLRR